MLNWLRNIMGQGEHRVSGEDALAKVRAGATLLDVRTPEEFAEGSVPDAVNIPVQVLDGRLSEIDDDAPVVVFCRSGGRSATATAKLAGAGYEVYDAGGIGNLRRD